MHILCQLTPFHQHKIKTRQKAKCEKEKQESNSPFPPVNLAVINALALASFAAGSNAPTLTLALFLAVAVVPFEYALNDEGGRCVGASVGAGDVMLSLVAFLDSNAPLKPLPPPPPNPFLGRTSSGLVVTIPTSNSPPKSKFGIGIPRPLPLLSLDFASEA